MRKLSHVAALATLTAFASCDCGKNVMVEENAGAIQLDSTRLDFGPVTEFTQATRPIVIRNVGRAPLALTAATVEGSSAAEFSAAALPAPIAVSGTANLNITFSPLGAGEDDATVVITSDDPEHPQVRVELHGGPIFPALDFDPDGGFLSFVPSSQALTSKYVQLRSAGGSTLTITSVGVAPTGNPDFSVVRPTLPSVLKPGEALPVQVDYSKSTRAQEGILSVNSDDADAGRRTLRLIPDPARACSDGADNDNDGLSDFPDDPGCSSSTDEDEYNDPQCVDGATRACGNSVGLCRPGAQSCRLGAWYPCDGGTRPATESCNGFDDDCDGTSDEDISELCTVNGCPGARACLPGSGVDGGQFTACQPVMSQSETCNGRDDDCDGQIDNGIVQTCTINGCLGTRICIPGGDGGFTACQPANPATEICDGIDNNCDGTIDNVTPALRTCGFGVCARTVPACVDGGMPVCTPGSGTAEICNGIDDDCDGTADNGLAGLTCGLGACFRSVPACLPDGGSGVCVPGAQMPETCNNIDDNCNGSTDESLTRSCYSGAANTLNVGICRGGMQSCSAGSWGSTCPGEVLPQASEGCANTTDDNCNGQVNEGCDAGGCDPRGMWTKDGGPIVFTCCQGLVSINVNRFFFGDAGTALRVLPQPTQPGNNLTSSSFPVCPTGSFTASRTLSGGCTETYTLIGTFISANTWQGTYSATFTGAQCTDPSPFPFGCANDPCNDFSVPVQANR